MTRPNPLALSEASFQSVIIGLARTLGWRVHHTRPAQIRPGRWATPITGDAGFPDLVLTHPHRGTIFAELKTSIGRLSDAQVEWLAALNASGAEAYVWRPTDLDAVKARLGGRS